MWSAEAIRHLPANPIQALAAEARRRRTFGRGVIDLSVGEPDFPPPPEVAEAVARSAAADRTGYPPAEGLAHLRHGILRRLAAEGLNYRSRELAVTAGASGATSAAFRALLEPGAGVLVPVPAYGAYGSQIRLAGGTPVPVPTRWEDGWRLRPDAVREAVASSGARILVFNDPANPTGAVHDPDELDALAAVVEELDLFVVCDEVYRDFVYGGPAAVSLVAQAPSLRERALVVRSFSKSYGMTGWRVGWAAGPAEVVAALVRVQQTLFIAPAAPSQWAALAALEAGPEWVAERVAAYADRHRRVHATLASVPGVVAGAPRGAFFAFPDLSAACGDVDAFCRRLLEVHDLVVVPGSVFGAPGSLRLSFATAPELLDEGLTRLVRALEEVRRGLAA
jgi:aspartate aminotransferase